VARTDPRLAGGWAPVYEPAIVKKALSPEVCQRTIAVANKLGFQDSPVKDARGVGIVYDPDHRRSQVVWLNPEHDDELFRLVTNLFQKTNNERYRFSIYGMAPIQILKYSSGCFFSEHFDLGLDEAANRKVSLIIQLSEPADYEGGAFILSGRVTLPKDQGTACVFPSWFQHQVDTVESGTRYSLAAWALGSYFL
jgi:PKHD-type hydroxylase